MTDRTRPYVSYLLRLWLVQDSAPLIWRASLESSPTGERHSFADLRALFAYLTSVTSVHLEDADAKRTPSDGDVSDADS